MKTILNTSKRKKIRTRKSLNAIRNRSRRLIHSDLKLKGMDEMGNNRRNTNFVTSNRLTLQMFPNAVRSETVTRFSNDGKDRLNINFKDLIPNKETLCITSELISDDKSDSENSVQSISDHNEQKSDIKTDLESPQVFSGYHRESTVAQPAINNTHIVSPLTDTSQHCTHDKYYLYEQFMSNLSGYLKQTLPASLFREDVMDNLKDKLLNMKIQSHNDKQLKHKAMHSDNYTSDMSEDLMVEDPMDYIRLSYKAMPNSPSQESVCSTGTSECVDSLFHLQSPQLLSSSSRTDISDTPEYIYFPHKLN